MFIKLTKLDGSPIWLNAGFVVTVEQRRGGGSIVVPVGDGLDYDVRESPEAVLNMLGDEPASKVVPIPTSDALSKSHAERPHEIGSAQLKVSQQAAVASEPVAAKQKEGTLPAQPQAQEPQPQPESVTPPAEIPNAVQTVPEIPASVDAIPSAGEDVKPVRKATRAKAGTKRVVKAKAKTVAAPVELDEALVERLRKMAPGSVRKLANTLAVQFKAENPEATIQALEERGLIVIDKDHVDWKG